MPLILLLIGFFLLKSLLQLPFYFKRWKESLRLAGLTSLAVGPLITILYHETAADFWLVYLGMMVLDALLYVYLLQRNWWKAVPAAFLVNTFVMFYFYLGNG